MFPTQYPNNPIGFPGLGFEVNPNPAAFDIAGRSIYWYGILIALAFLLAALYTVRRAPRVGIKQDTFIDALLFAVPIAIIFSRLYYVVFNLKEFQISAENPNPMKFYEIWKGGIAIYGAIIGAVITVWIFCRIRKVKFSAMMDVGAMGLLIGQCIGRWGNFFNREAFGTPTDLPWRMEVYVENMNGQFVGERMAVHPTFLYESLWCLVGFLVLHSFLKRRKFNGQIFLMYVAWYGLGRSFIEGLRTDSLFFMDTNLRVSQFLGVVSCLLALGLLAYNLFFKDHETEELTDLTLLPAAGAAAVTDGTSETDPSVSDEGAAEDDADTEEAPGAAEEEPPADTQTPPSETDAEEDKT